MTSRRSFLGLLAAAPLAAPAMAKAVAEPNLISGMAMQWGEPIAIRYRLPNVTVRNGQRFKDWSRVSHTLDFDTGEIWREYLPLDTPNRLHGVAINADGDAI